MPQRKKATIAQKAKKANPKKRSSISSLCPRELEELKELRDEFAAGELGDHNLATLRRFVNEQFDVRIPETSFRRFMDGDTYA